MKPNDKCSGGSQINSDQWPVRWNSVNRRQKDGLKYRQEQGMLLKTPNERILNSD